MCNRHDTDEVIQPNESTLTIDFNCPRRPLVVHRNKLQGVDPKKLHQLQICFGLDEDFQSLVHVLKRQPVLTESEPPRVSIASTYRSPPPQINMENIDRGDDFLIDQPMIQPVVQADAFAFQAPQIPHPERQGQEVSNNGSPHQRRKRKHQEEEPPAALPVTDTSKLKAPFRTDKSRPKVALSDADVSDDEEPQIRNKHKPVDADRRNEAKRETPAVKRARLDDPKRKERRDMSPRLAAAFAPQTQTDAEHDQVSSIQSPTLMHLW